jgi:hypothetical protein
VGEQAAIGSDEEAQSGAIDCGTEAEAAGDQATSLGPATAQLDVRAVVLNISSSQAIHAQSDEDDEDGGRE